MNDRGAGVLEQYELQIRQINRGRGALLCDTDKGLKLLKEYKGSGKKAVMLQQVLFHLQNHFSYVDQFVKNQQGEVVSKDKDGKNYILKDWYEGRECDVRSAEEVGRAAAVLAMLHRSFIAPKECEYTFFSEGFEEECVRHNRELRKIRRFIRERGKNTEFEIAILHHYPYFYEQAQKIQEKVSASAVKELENTVKQERLLCHGDYNQHQILFVKQEIAVTNFDRCHIGVQQKDLCQFMRKVLEKNNWNPHMGKVMLQSYFAVLPGKAEIRDYILYRLSYPEKFFKLCNQYYNSNKAWVPEKMMYKLEMVVAQEESKCQFLQEIRESWRS